MNIEEYRNNEKERIKSNIKRMNEDGVIFLDIYSAYIDEEAEIESGVTIFPNVIIKGKTRIYKNATIGLGTVIENSIIGENANIKTAYIYDSDIGKNTSVGPFAYIRPGSMVGDNCKVGDFVEIKNSNLGNETKASHLAYIGDADLGSGVNVGCGVVFVNFDGDKKYRTNIEDDSFIGCNSNLIAPVKVGEGSYIAAGTTVTEDIPEDALAIGRSRQTTKTEWVKKRKILRKDK